MRDVIHFVYRAFHFQITLPGVIKFFLLSSWQQRIVIHSPSSLSPSLSRSTTKRLYSISLPLSPSPSRFKAKSQRNTQKRQRFLSLDQTVWNLIEESQSKRLENQTNKPAGGNSQMSHFDWNELAVSFTLAADTAGLSPFLIHIQLVQNGYSQLQLYTVEQCLRAHGREIDNVTPYHGPLYHISTADAEMYGHCFAYNEIIRIFSLSSFSVGEAWRELRQNGSTVSILEVAARLIAERHYRSMRDVDQ